MLPVIALIGLGLGVVINLLADSLPIQRRVTGSCCQTCGGPRPLSAWSALVGTVAGGNRCRYCGTGRGVRSVVIEVGAILGATALYLRDPGAWPLATGVSRRLREKTGRMPRLPSQRLTARQPLTATPEPW